MIVYAESSGQQSTNSGSWTAIPGLAITLPRGDSALLILNIPNPYAQGHNLPGGNFGLQVNGEVLSAFACFTYNEESPPSTGRVPTTLSVVTPLSSFRPDIGRGGVVRRARRHRAHRQPGDADRHHRLSGKAPSAIRHRQTSSAIRLDSLVSMIFSENRRPLFRIML